MEIGVETTINVVKTQKQRKIAKKYTKKTGSITVIVLHDIALAARYSDEILLLHEGYSVQQGIPEDVLKEELLEEIYGVELDISKSSRGFISITPIKTK